ncbi:MAG: vitamin B12-dependent ribonucleotide reductase [candidate division Zixibacteria bacterium]|nr:vitamin B12-dependent ribonucleotide reductase [candidate division Zixibacteria bacterium]
MSGKKIDIRISPNAMTVLKRRYLMKDAEGRVIETPHDLFVRVANFIAEADRQYGAGDGEVRNSAHAFYEMMASLDFLPNSPTLMNAGRPLGQLSACFVLPVGDSMDEIFETNKHAALIHKSGGGTGFSFSRLRPKNSVVASTSGVASGPVSFMRVYNASTEAVKQGGTRRGANMGILRVDHPDILDFISCKDDTSEFTNFNISVAITDTFMAAVKAGDTYPLINPKTGRVHIIDGKEAHLEAREVFRRIVEHAWRTGEPGVIFLDRMNRLNPTSPSESIEATNPCGEQPLPPYDSCNLGSINLSHLVKAPLPTSYSINEPTNGIDWDKFASLIRRGVHFLDNVIDQNQYPIAQIEAQTRRNRRIGLGVMGWADMLVKLRLPYHSAQAFELADKVMSYLQSEARACSSELARTRGRFPNWDGSVYRAEDVSMRNATVTTIAPTGTISIIAGCSSGIEPFYSLAYERNVLDGTRMIEINPLFEHAAHEQGFYSETLIRKVASLRSISEFEEIPESVRSLFVTAADVPPADHVRMQAVFQKHCDSSVSKTINLPEGATPEDVRAAFELAYDLECKGVTIYRDNSRPNQVLASIKKDHAPAIAASPVEKRPQVLEGFTEKIRTGYGNLYVTVNLKDGRPFEVFATIGKSGYTTMADSEAICRLISMSLRGGVPVEEIVRQLRGIGGSSQVYSDGARIFSIPDAIAQVLGRRFCPSLQNGAKAPEGGVGDGPDSGKSPGSAQPSEICPECDQPMTFDAGCYHCSSCGYSNC